MACILHAHLLLLFKNLGVDDVNKTVASVVLSAQVRFFLFIFFISVCSVDPPSRSDRGAFVPARKAVS